MELGRVGCVCLGDMEEVQGHSSTPCALSHVHEVYEVSVCSKTLAGLGPVTADLDDAR